MRVVGELGVRQSNAAQRGQRRTASAIEANHSRSWLARIVAAEVQAVGEQVELALLDAVFHVAAGAVDLLVQALWLGILAAERGDDEARVGRTCRPFGLGNDPTLAAPAVASTIESVNRRAGWPVVLPSSSAAPSFAGNLGDKPLVLRPGQRETRPCWPRTNSSEHRGQTPTLGARRNTHLRPAGADLGDNARGLLDRPGGRVDVAQRHALPPTDAGHLSMYSGR